MLYRSSASRASLKNSKEININAIHPLFRKEGENFESLTNMLDQIKNYKPKIAYLEINKSKGKSADYNKYVGIVSKLKKNEERSKQKKEIAEKMEKDEEILDQENPESEIKEDLQDGQASKENNPNNTTPKYKKRKGKR